MASADDALVERRRLFVVPEVRGVAWDRLIAHIVSDKRKEGRKKAYYTIIISKR